MRLCDFGFAATVEHSTTGSTAAPLQDGCGTVMYMAPELAGKTPGLTHGLPVDWWALGCVLFELVTGKMCVFCVGSMVCYSNLVQCVDKQ